MTARELNLRWAEQVSRFARVDQCQVIEHKCTVISRNWFMDVMRDPAIRWVSEFPGRDGAAGRGSSYRGKPLYIIEGNNDILEFVMEVKHI